MIVTKHISPDKDRIEKIRHAFGNKVELKVIKSVTYGDNFSEVMIRIP